MGLYWLASYPKSGNTWLRVLLSDYFAGDRAPVPLDRLSVRADLTARDAFDDLLGLPSADLRPDEIDRYRPRVCRLLAADVGANPYFVKLHSALSRNAAGDFLFPPDATAGVVYVARNPLDVAASLAPFFGWTLDRAIEAMADDDFVLNPARGGLPTVLAERPGSWSTHARSWLDAPGYRVHLVRYEDLLADPAGTFGRVLRFAGLDPDPGQVERAVARARFERLQAEEARSGFPGLPATAAAPFFRQGRSGAWQGVLTPAQVDRIVSAHGATMERLGYAARPKPDWLS